MVTHEPSPDIFDEADLVDPRLWDVAEEAKEHGEIIIVGTEDCPNCGAVQQLFEEELGSERVRYVDIGEPEGAMLDNLFDGIEAVPFITYRNRATNDYTECHLTSEYEDANDPTSPWIWSIDCNPMDPSKTRHAEETP
ncbi:MAG: hypothetical protein WC145_07465 [Aliarcobacter sp.]